VKFLEPKRNNIIFREAKPLAREIFSMAHLKVWA